MYQHSSDLYTFENMAILKIEKFKRNHSTDLEENCSNKRTERRKQRNYQRQQYSSFENWGKLRLKIIPKEKMYNFKWVLAVAQSTAHNISVFKN